jgi:hypothetical protein
MHYRGERLSGWYDDPWLWDSIRSNAGFITQFSSKNDGLIPWNEHQHVADNLHSELHMWAPLVLGGGWGWGEGVRAGRHGRRPPAQGGRPRRRGAPRSVRHPYQRADRSPPQQNNRPGSMNQGHFLRKKVPEIAEAIINKFQ